MGQILEWGDVKLGFNSVWITPCYIFKFINPKVTN